MGDSYASRFPYYRLLFSRSQTMVLKLASILEYVTPRSNLMSQRCIGIEPYVATLYHAWMSLQVPLRDR